MGIRGRITTIDRIEEVIGYQDTANARVGHVLQRSFQQEVCVPASRTRRRWHRLRDSLKTVPHFFVMKPRCPPGGKMGSIHLLQRGYISLVAQETACKPRCRRPESNGLIDLEYFVRFLIAQRPQNAHGGKWCNRKRIGLECAQHWFTCMIEDTDEARQPVARPWSKKIAGKEKYDGCSLHRFSATRALEHRSKAIPVGRKRMVFPRRSRHGNTIGGRSRVPQLPPWGQHSESSE
jgi:hypothetical protein